VARRPAVLLVVPVTAGPALVSLAILLELQIPSAAPASAASEA